MAKGDRLSSADVADRLRTLDGWSEREGKLHRELQFASFVEAFSFMTGVALVAESMNHHPDWCNSYRTVVVDLSSHDVGGISERDCKLATAIEAAWKRSTGA